MRIRFRRRVLQNLCYGTLPHDKDTAELRTKDGRRGLTAARRSSPSGRAAQSARSGGETAEIRPRQALGYKTPELFYQDWLKTHPGRKEALSDTC